MENQPERKQSLPKHESKESRQSEVLRRHRTSSIQSGIQEEIRKRVKPIRSIVRKSKFAGLFSHSHPSPVVEEEPKVDSYEENFETPKLSHVHSASRSTEITDKRTSNISEEKNQASTDAVVTENEVPDPELVLSATDYGKYPAATVTSRNLNRWDPDIKADDRDDALTKNVASPEDYYLDEPSPVLNLALIIYPYLNRNLLLWEAPVRSSMVLFVPLIALLVIEKFGFFNCLFFTCITMIHFTVFYQLITYILLVINENIIKDSERRYFMQPFVYIHRHRFCLLTKRDSHILLKKFLPMWNDTLVLLIRLISGYNQVRSLIFLLALWSLKNYLSKYTAISVLLFLHISLFTVPIIIQLLLAIDLKLQITATLDNYSLVNLIPPDRVYEYFFLKQKVPPKDDEVSSEAQFSGNVVDVNQPLADEVFE